jgi:hypothetical protein
MNDSANFHPIVGGVFGTTMQVLLMTAGAQDGTPTPRTGVAFAGAIGINNNMRKSFGVWHAVNLLDLAYLLTAGDFPLQGSIE